MSTRRLLIFVVVIGLALAGCTGAAPATPAPDTGTPSPAAPPIAPTDDGEDGDDDDAPHQVPELEAMLPSEVLGVAVRKASVSGEQAIADLTISDPVLDAITAAGASPSEIQAAVGADEDDSFLITAIRVPGIDAQALRAAVVAANDPVVLPVREGQIAGKDVVSLGDIQFFYATGDILFSVFAEVNAANEIISQLP